MKLRLPAEPRRVAAARLARAVRLSAGSRLALGVRVILGARLALGARVIAAVCAVLLAGGWIAQASTPPVGPLTVQVTETSGAAMLVAEPAIRASAGPPADGTEVIDVNDAVRHQQITGFGAAMTDSSAWLLEDELSASTRAAVMRSLFSPSGLHLTSVLIPMGASDFTAGGTPYSYDDLPPGHSDPTLSEFSIAHDRAWDLPVLRQALSLDRNLSFIAVPWSVPAWMKTNDALSSVKGAGSLNPEDDQAYADYFIDFLRAYAAAGIPVGEVIPANEPTAPTAYPGMNIPAATEATLVERYLVPTLRRDGLSTLVDGSDLGWGRTGYAAQIATGAAAGDLSGIAWHCYYGSPTAMSRVQALDPRLGVQMTECSPGISTESESEVVIESLRNDASLVDLWNIALDDQGGPVQMPNEGCPGCSGLLAVDTATHTVQSTPALADLGQASAFIEPGAVRIGSNSFVGYAYTGPGRDYATANVDDVAVQNPDHQIVLMTDNNAASPRRISVVWHGWSFSDTLAPGATVTFRWSAP